MWRLRAWLIRSLEVIVIIGGLIMFVREGAKDHPDGAVMAAWLGLLSAPATARTVLTRRGGGSSSTAQEPASPPLDSSLPPST